MKKETLFIAFSVRQILSLEEHCYTYDIIAREIDNKMTGPLWMKKIFLLESIFFLNNK